MIQTGTSLPVMETFYTVQGEGAFAGAPAYFIRLAGCDVGCVWCDVKESWDETLHPMQQVEDLVTAVVASGAPLCVITGGEPLMHNLDILTEGLRKHGIRTHLETSGTQGKGGRLCHLNNPLWSGTHERFSRCVVLALRR